MKESNMPKADFLTSIFLVAFGAAMLAMALAMPRFEAQNANPYSVPGIVPSFLGAIITVLGIVLLVRSTRQGGYRLGLNGATVRGFLSDPATRRFLLTLLVSAAYALGLLGRIPYSIATGLYVFVFIVLFEYDRSMSLAAQWKRVAIAALVALLSAAIVTAVFRYLFLVDLPG